MNINRGGKICMITEQEMKQNGADEKKVGVFFEFFLECFYFKHVQFKFQEHDNNNSHQFKELLHKNPKVP